MNQSKLLSSLFIVVATISIFSPAQRALSQPLAKFEGTSRTQDPILAAQVQPSPNPTPQPTGTPIGPVAPPTPTPDPACEKKCTGKCTKAKRIAKTGSAILSLVSSLGNKKTTLGGGSTNEEIDDAYSVCIAACAVSCLPK